MRTNTRSSREPPDQPGVDVAEERIAALGRLACAGDIIENPSNLRPGEVRCQWKTHFLTETVLAPVLRESVTDLFCARVLPDDGVVVRFASLSIPDDRGLTLVGDPHPSEIAGPHVRCSHSSTDDLFCSLPNLKRIVLDPSRLRVDLFVFLLCHTDRAALAIENHATRARGSLIDGGYKSPHGSDSSA